jgi:predicted ATPase
MDATGRIRYLNIEGLHEQFDVELEFNSGLNIIYGKNGRGKTTVLHIIANTLELAFERFKYLSFRTIILKNFSDDKLEIVKNEKGVILAFFNDQLCVRGGILVDGYENRIRASFGPTPTYLPAFRSVLERMRDANYRTDSAESEFAIIEKQEFESIRNFENSTTSRTRFFHQFREEAALTARKTVQCRQWFGPFIPIVRYPSIAEVNEGLTEEWNDAQLEIARLEQNVFAEVFIKVFRAIVGMDTPKNSALHSDSLLSLISDSLSDEDDQEENSDYQLGNHKTDFIYRQLSEAMDFMQRNAGKNAQETETAVLMLYLEMLTRRKQERRAALQKTREFEISVNKFLDSKKFTIGTTVKKAPYRRESISVKSAGGNAYGPSALSSGEKQILTMLYSASRTRHKTGLFLIDEPELSLHIDWQRIILKELIAQSPDRQIIACTHSPEVGAEHFYETQSFEPKPTRVMQIPLFPDEAIEE